MWSVYIGENNVTSIRVCDVPEGSTSSCFRDSLVGIEVAVVTDEELRRNPPGNLDVFYCNGSHEEYVVRRSAVVAALDKAGQRLAAEFWGMSVAQYLVLDCKFCKVLD